MATFSFGNYEHNYQEYFAKAAGCLYGQDLLTIVKVFLIAAEAETYLHAPTLTLPQCKTSQVVGKKGFHTKFNLWMQISATRTERLSRFTALRRDAI